MTTKVADVRANLNENILFAVKIIGKSIDRRKVFEAIYYGKKEIKTVDAIAFSRRTSRAARTGSRRARSPERAHFSGNSPPTGAASPDILR